MAKLYARHNAFGDTPGSVKYAYGDPWVAQALYMDDIKFDTPQEAKAWWIANYGEDDDNEFGEEDELYYGNETSDF